MDLTHAEWKKSNRSGGNGNCVEVALNLPDVVAVRDTKDRDGAVLAFRSKEWQAFIAGVKSNEFDPE
ncbi:DUF397 domain-containing protein [Couchioplanes caeruleus]|uniref:DUF397 domain-containing protein n=1 Tax=Couchioplanes caeruleus TaxID=56438 RepID=UPI0020BED715|nr:DUF397 domain-containing protein [Couchioplanes caeruleus]UQU65792.1 DUF397 domain-containing protein [Couchioplanes caeruleus]